MRNLINHFLLSEEMLNKNFIKLQLPLGKEIYAQFYGDINNINQ